MRPRTWPGLLSHAQAAVGGLFVVMFVGFSLWARFPAPYRDDWDWLLSYFEGPAGIAGLLRPHNEHVIPLARLLFAAHYQIGGLGGQLIQNVAVACQLIIASVFCREIARQWPDQPARRRFVQGVVLVCLCAAQQLQSVVFAAAALFPLVQLWATLSVWAFLHATDTPASSRRGPWWGLAIACTVLATASTTSGMAVPLVLAGLAWLRGEPRRVVLGFGAMTVACMLGYAWWVGIGVPGAGSGVVDLWSRPGAAAMVAYGFAVFGVGLSYVSTPAAVVVGAVVMAGVAAAGIVAIRRPALLTRLEAFALGQMAFGVASVIMVTPGRAQFGVAQAGQSRYATFAVCVIAALVVFAAGRIARGRSRGASTLGVAVLATTALLIIPNVYVGLLWVAKADNVALAFLSVRSGAPDPAWLVTLHPAPHVVQRVLAHVEAGGGRVVDARVMTPLETGTVTAVAAAADGARGTCGGAGQLVRRSDTGAMTLTGRMPDSIAGAVVVDASGTIVGLTRPEPWVAAPEPSVRMVHATILERIATRRAPTDAWTGFAQQGAGPPYRWVATRSQAASLCEEPLVVAPLIRAQLDTVGAEGPSAGAAAGWAFACGEAVTDWQLLIDGRAVAVRVTPGLARPDVERAFRDACGPASAPGAHLQFELAALPEGRHRAILQVVTASGYRGQSPVLEFDR